MKLKNITPKALRRCIGLGCPAIFEGNNDTYVIVGKILDLNSMTPQLKKQVSPGETAIEIPKNLLAMINK